MLAAKTLKEPVVTDAQRFDNAGLGTKVLGERRNSNFENYCPVCSAELKHEKCKVICRSEKCVYRIIFNCSEF